MVNANNTLKDLVIEDSWYFLSLLNLDHSFLGTNAESWEQIPACKSSQAAVTSLNVINDYAEIGVIMGSDILNVARNEEHYQIVIQVVELNWGEIPNL